MLTSSFLNDMNTNLQNLQTIQEQMASGKNFQKPSDDPFDVTTSMRLNASINANTQYNKNITSTSNWLDTTDTALSQMNSVFQNINGQLISAGNAAYGTSERQSIKDEINQNISQVAQILNTNFDGEYIFGGTRVASKPVDSTTVFTLPATVNQSNSSGGSAALTGSFTGDETSANYTVKIDSVNSGQVTGVSYSTDGTNWTSVTTANSDGTFSIGNGLNIKLNTNTANVVNDTYTFSMNQDTKLIYRDNNGNEMAINPVESSNVTVANWSGQTIGFNITPSSSTTSAYASIKLSNYSSTSTIDDVVSDINNQINNTQSNPATTPPTYPLKGEVLAEKTSDGKISFKSLSDNNTIEIAPVGTSTNSTTVSDLSSSTGQKIPSIDYDMIQSSRKTEISEGVLVQYNTSATDVINYGTNAGDNVNALFQRIVNNLNGYVAETDSNGNVMKDSSGNIIYTANSAEATSLLTGQDLTDLDSAMSKLSSVQSQVGAKENSMTSAQTQNQQNNTDLTTILSNTEDIDITKKTMEYATAQTVYTAALQTGAKVIQPTLMDYLSNG
jgi:flagellar hook-associated protein 3 FlgL